MSHGKVFDKYFLGYPYLTTEGAIMLWHSDDEGKTWSQPVEIDDAPALPRREYPLVFAPALAVNDRFVFTLSGMHELSPSDVEGLAIPYISLRYKAYASATR